MTPGFAKSRQELFWLPYPEPDRVIINAHNFNTAWTPAQITTVLWLDAADETTLFDAVSGGSLVAADGAIARWQDKSGNARHVTQSTSGSRPTRRTAVKNARDIVRFDGTDDVLTTSFSDFGTSYAFVAVASSSVAGSGTGAIIGCRSSVSVTPVNPQIAFTGGSSNFVARDDASVANSAPISGLTNSQWYLFGGIRSGSSVTAYRDGTAGTTVSNTLGTISTNITSVGALYAPTLGTFLTGDIAEIVVCGTADRAIVEGYLAHKWGVASSLPSGHLYKSVAP